MLRHAVLMILAASPLRAQGTVSDAFGILPAAALSPERAAWAGLRSGDAPQTVAPAPADTVLLFIGPKSLVAGAEDGHAVALAVDRHGNLAAATSTGGVTNKRFGRIGDSPLVGSGTYANNLTCAVSCTGYGEYFIRGVVAYDLSCLMEYAGLNLNEAARKVIWEKQLALGGDGGLIAVDAQGGIVLEFNSEGMYRAWEQEGAAPQTAIFREG